MGRRRKRFLQTLVGGPLDGQQRWMWGNTDTYFYPTPAGEEILKDKIGYIDVPCHIYRVRPKTDKFDYQGIENRRLCIVDEI